MSSLKILIIGGTQFLGRHLAEGAILRGHKTTLFNRGKSGSLLDSAENITGDRCYDLKKLLDRRFDVVIDTCGYYPTDVECSTQFFKGKIGSYVFISSSSVYDYRNQEVPFFKEQSEIVGTEVDVSDDSLITYGPRKLLCESVVKREFPQNHLIVRPGALIVGPLDYTFRLLYWMDRMTFADEVLAPGRGDAPIQYIDVRDLSSWILDCLESGIWGLYNAVLPYNEMTLEKLLESLKTQLRSATRITWVPESFLVENEVVFWQQLPLWVPECFWGFMRVDPSLAISKGLKFRSFDQTIKDTHEWFAHQVSTNLYENVLSPEHEKELLRKYREQEIFWKPS